MHIIIEMSEIIRVHNIENYIQEIINGELVLTPKNLKKNSDDDFVNEQIARYMFLEYNFHIRRSEQYELEITECTEEQHEFLKRQVAMIQRIKINIKNNFVQRFGEKLWSNLRLEYGYEA